MKEKIIEVLRECPNGLRLRELAMYLRCNRFALLNDINDLHKAGKDSELPYEGMLLTTIVAEAERMVDLENGPEKFDLSMGALALGNVALVGIPGEPFTEIGRAIKNAPGWDLVMPMCCTNGYEGYFPTMDAYLEGGYEARSSIFKAGVAEAVADTAVSMLNKIRK